MKDFSKYSAIIIGAGDATGASLTKKFAEHGYKVCPARRPGSIDKVKQLAEEINSSGLSQSELNELLLKKIEELNLYIIELNNEINGFQKINL